MKGEYPQIGPNICTIIFVAQILRKWELGEKGSYLLNYIDNCMVFKLLVIIK